MTGGTDRLSGAALLYLAAPSFVYLAAWIEPIPAIGAIIVLCWGLWRLLVQLPARDVTHGAGAWVYLAILASVWAGLGGAGHLVYANIDWASRDSVYADLVLGGWPVAYLEHDGAAVVLRTSMGYFLPPAVLAKLFGIEWAPVLLFAWTALGTFLFLALLPLPHRFGPRLVALSLVPVLFSGMDYLGILLTLGHVPLFPLPLEWWGKWTYSSMTAQLFWAPNHAIALWLGAALFFRYRRDTRLPALGLLLLPLVLIWTPFAPMGLLPWFAWAIWQLGRRRSPWMLGTTPIQWVAAVALTLLVSALFSAPGVPAAFSTPTLPGGAWDISHSGALDIALYYVQFVGCEFLLLSIVLLPNVGRLRAEWAAATLLLLLIPAIRFGPSNDWVLRASTPSLVILMIVTLQALESGFASAASRRALWPVLLILGVGAITPSFEIARALMWRRTPPNYGHSLLETQRGFLAPHYLGRLEGGLRERLFRTPVRVPEGAARKALLHREPPHP